MRVTSSSVFSPVRTRYVTETQSGAWPASAATVRSRTSTSLSSRGAMNSNEMLGRLRASRSAILIGAGNSTNPYLREGEQRRLPGRQAGSAYLLGPPLGEREREPWFPLIFLP